MKDTIVYILVAGLLLPVYTIAALGLWALVIHVYTELFVPRSKP